MSADIVTLCWSVINTPSTVSFWLLSLSNVYIQWIYFTCWRSETTFIPQCLYCWVRSTMFKTFIQLENGHVVWHWGCLERLQMCALHRRRATQTSVWLHMEIKNITWAQSCKKTQTKTHESTVSKKLIHNNKYFGHWSSPPQPPACFRSNGMWLSRLMSGIGSI